METKKDMKLNTKVVHAIYFTVLAWQHQPVYNCKLFSSVQLLVLTQNLMWTIALKHMILPAMRISFSRH
jgi:hypothetical protein